MSRNRISDEDLRVWEEFVKSGVTLIERDYPKSDPRRPKTEKPKEIPKNYIDLHGLTVHEAWATTLNFIQKSQQNNQRKIKIITGYSGQIRKEFTGWLVSEKFKKYISSYQEKNRSSFLVYIKLPKKC